MVLSDWSVEMLSFLLSSTDLWVWQNKHFYLLGNDGCTPLSFHQNDRVVSRLEPIGRNLYLNNCISTPHEMLDLT